jgi:hypothetical protein
MQVSIQKGRPPYVMFERRSEEDRAESIKQGHYVGRDVDYALITPSGSRDQIERRVDEWFTMLEKQVRDGRYDSQWLRAYRHAYQEWCEGREAPLNGTALTTWPAISPTNLQKLLSLNVRTVEDLAQANEETIQRIGMGGRALKDQAIQWLAASKDVGQVAMDAAAQRQMVEQLQVQNEQLQRQNELLSAQLQALASAPVGVQPGVQTTADATSIGADDLGLNDPPAAATSTKVPL